MGSPGHAKNCTFGCKWDGKEFIVKKWLLAAGLGLAMATSAQAADKIAIVNMGSLFQQVAQKTGVSNTLETSSKAAPANCSAWNPICNLKCSVCNP